MDSEILRRQYNSQEPENHHIVGGGFQSPDSFQHWLSHFVREAQKRAEDNTMAKQIWNKALEMISASTVKTGSCSHIASFTLDTLDTLDALESSMGP